VELTKEQIEDFYAYLADHTIELVEARSTSIHTTRSASRKKTR